MCLMFILGFTAGLIVTRFAIQYSMYYLGKHPELWDKFLDDNPKLILKQLKEKADRLEQMDKYM